MWTAGRCIKCGQNAVGLNTGYCLRHLIFRMLTKAGLTKGRLREPERVRREKLVAYLSGRFFAIKAGHLNETRDMNQARLEAADLFDRLHVKWRGLKGANKMANILRCLDRRAFKDRVEVADAPIPVGRN